ncbi:mitochondrial inner membrane protein required for protein import [Recurvomyces mirabilis]|uniref:mitochondrial inner membrane protein required for protein import n=1 Tax=Recurvomyces mirabilis TaxID=574656 RepID=UPI002DE08F50|nr:mitochondrial inner membrane protein required for protein import [Recurvomyces mirabilis]
MLQRAALRAIRPSSTTTTTTTTTPLHITRTALTASATRIRAYADRPRRPPPPPPASSRPGARPPPPSRPAPPSATARARQTSPGTTLPKDQTWKPADGIKMGGAAMPSAANAANRAEDARRAKTSVNGTRPALDATIRQAPLEPDPTPIEPQAQRLDADEPATGSLRGRVQDAQAQAENTPPPPEASAPTEPEPFATGPLPDLRQGIPSTFDIEFGQKTQDQTREERPSKQTDGMDPSSTTPKDRRQDGESNRSYDRSAYETSLDRRRAQMANWLYAGILASIVTGTFYLARPFNAREEVPTGLPPDEITGWAPGKMYARLRARMGSQMGYYTEPTFPKLLPEIPEAQRQPYTLVLSLEDLLIHNTWDREHGYRTAKRPGIDYFILYLSQYYELVLFTSAPISIADPIIKKLDPFHFIMWPLGREATKYENGQYIKDLSYLNRPLSKTLILDTVKGHVANQPENAIILPKWTGDKGDPRAGDLVRLIPFLENLAAMGTEDVRPVLKSFEGKEIHQEFAAREAEARRLFNAQYASEQSRRPKLSLGSLAGALGVKSTPGMGGGMVLADGQTVSEGFAKGKMLSDQIREQGQRQYEAIETQIREHGAEWLKEEEEEIRRQMESGMRDMKQGALGWFGGGAGKGEGGK